MAGYLSGFRFKAMDGCPKRKGLRRALLSVSIFHWFNWSCITRGVGGQTTNANLMTVVPAYFSATTAGGAYLCQAAIAGDFAILAGTRPERVIAVMNPGSGPNLAARDTTLCWQQLSRTGVSKILGYVATGYGANNFTYNFPDGSNVNRTLPVVLNNIDTYFNAYMWNASVRLDGIFLDEAATWYYLGYGQKATPATQLAFYTAIVDRIRQWDQRLYRRSTIVANPGGKVMPGLLSLDIDWVVAFESAAAQWRNPDYHGVCPPPSFTNPLDPSNNQYCGGQGFAQYCPPGTPTNCYCAGNVKFAAMVHSQPASNYSAIINQVKTNTRYGAVYVTDKTLPNPYAQISSYFQGEMLLL